MATYKVPQDVEAEDKLIGPFSFRQFLFVIAFAGTGFLGWMLAQVTPFLTLPLIPPFVLFGIIGFYHPADQPVENKIIAYINFFLKPHRRMWSRDGVEQHVTIKAPKVVQHTYSDGRSQQEVRSQLKQLASIVDTRGWSAKRAEIQEPTSNPHLAHDDRIVSLQEVAGNNYSDALEIHNSDDMFDNNSSAVAQNFTQMTEASTKNARAEAIAHMREAAQAQTGSAPAPEPASTHIDPATITSTSPVVQDEQAAAAILEQAQSKPKINAHPNEKVIQPLSEQAAQANEQPSPATELPKPDNVAQKAQTADQAEADAKKAAAKEKYKELSKSDLPISSVAERIKDDSPGEDGVLQISH